jgi:dGTPase
VGLNLTYRTLASILKYDKVIPIARSERLELLEEGANSIEPIKAYYKSEEPLVATIKKKVTGIENYTEAFKTIECQIMDIADDIAYSTYDLEDALKVGFIGPFDVMFPDDKVIENITKKVRKHFPNISVDEVNDTLIRIFSRLLIYDFHGVDVSSHTFESLFKSNLHKIYRGSKKLASDGHLRTGFTSWIVGKFIRGIRFELNSDIPVLSKVTLNAEEKLEVEVLKNFTYESQILSSRIKITEFRGNEIINKIFTTLSSDRGHELLPNDYKEIYEMSNKLGKMRVICDFIAGMTDRYAIEFYGRITSENPETIFKPF